MANPNQVTLTFAGDSKSLERTFDKVGTAARELGDDFDRAEKDAKSFRGVMDDATGAVGNSEGKFMGAADLLDGLGGAFGLPTEGATGLARSFGDLTGGVGTLGGSFTAMLGPIGFAAAAIGGLALASEGFREVIGGVVGTVTTVVGGFFGFLSGGTDDAAEDVEAMEKRQEEALAQAKADWDTYTSGVQSNLETLASPLDKYEVDTKVTMDTVMETLTANLTTMDEWTKNLRTIAARGFGLLAEELLKEGPAAANAVAQFAAAADVKLVEAEALFGRAGEQTGQAFTEGLARTLQVPDSPMFGPTTEGAAVTRRQMTGGNIPAAPPYGGGYANQYNVSVQAWDGKDAGDKVVGAIRTYERSNGTGWRN